MPIHLSSRRTGAQEKICNTNRYYLIQISINVTDNRWINYIFHKCKSFNLCR